MKQYKYACLIELEKSILTLDFSPKTVIFNAPLPRFSIVDTLRMWLVNVACLKCSYVCEGLSHGASARWANFNMIKKIF